MTPSEVHLQQQLFFTDGGYRTHDAHRCRLLQHLQYYKGLPEKFLLKLIKNKRVMNHCSSCSYILRHLEHYKSLKYQHETSQYIEQQQKSAVKKQCPNLICCNRTEVNIHYEPDSWTQSKAKEMTYWSIPGSSTLMDSE
jgi:hypothetical protein